MRGVERPPASLSIDGDHAYALASDVTTVGRAADNDLVIDRPGISKHHATVVWDGERFVIEDVGSKNGTIVNGQRVSGRTAAQGGAEILLPGALLRLHVADNTATFALRAAELTIDAQRGEVLARGERVAVTAKEFTLLRYLADRAGTLVKHDEIADAVWPENNGVTTPESIEQLISKVRRKIERDPAHPVHLQTMRGLGYRLDL